MKLKVYRNQSDCDLALHMIVEKEKGNSNILLRPLFTIEISYKQTDLWYKENTRRFGKLRRGKNVKCYDIDECYGIGIISLEHSKEMIKFLTRK